MPLQGAYVEAYQNGDTPTGRTAVTDSQGYYAIQLPTPWSGNLLVQKKGYLFDATMSYSNRTTDITENINGVFLYGGGEGTSSSPFEIWTAAQMNTIGLNPYDWDQHFILMSDIDLGTYTGTTYAMIGVDQNESFSGVFNGNNHTISNFTYSTAAQVETIALFRAVRGETAVIQNLILENPQISADQSWDVAPLAGYLYQGTVSNCHVIGGQASGMWFVGGLAANSYYFDSNHGGIVENCSSSCDVTGLANNQTYVGGLVAHNSGLIRNSQASGNVTGNTYLGGLTGGTTQSIIPSESGAIYNSYATGQVTGTQKVGGLIGYNSGAVVTHCYSTGAVSGNTEVGGLCGKNRTDGIVLGQFHSCFWDQESSGQSVSDGGTGLATEDMQDALTFLVAGWDLEGETGNGIEDLWKICLGGTDYPRLSWESIQCFGTEIILYPTADTYVKSTEPETNFGSETSLVAGKSNSTSAIYRTFLKFDMSQIPDGYRIISAQLDLQANMVPFVDLEIGAWTTSESWDESQMTWNNQVSPYDSFPADTCIASTDYNRWDVTETADDRYCYDRELSIMLKSTDEAFAYSAGYWSSDLPTQTNKPRLIVQYAPIFGGGTGTPDDPFQIWTAEHMNSVGLYQNRWDRHYRLMADLSMADYTGSAYNPIGIYVSRYSSGNVMFKGVFDGNGHTLSDFQSGHLFGYLNGGIIKQVGLIAPNISGSAALVKTVEFGNVCECWVDGGSVTTSGNDAGALVGCARFSNIAGCRSSANVSGGDNVGGLIGRADGFVHLENCSATGNVSGQDNIGGFIGNSADSTMVHCYSAGTVSGTTGVGGFGGYAENAFTPGVEMAVGCFWDYQTSGTTQSAVGTGMPTAEMMNLPMFLNAGWDFVDETENGYNDDWAIPSGSGYPVLWYQLPTPPALPVFAGGNGTAGNPYQIATVQQLNSIGHHTRLLDKHFRLLNDLDLSGQPFTMIADGCYSFTGRFDGNGYTIRNMTISVPYVHSNLGFFGMVYAGSVSNLILRHSSVQAPYSRSVGSLAGLNFGGTIQTSHSQNADVLALWTVGGLVGGNYWYANISGCSVIGRVEENTLISILNSGVGGIVGENSWWSKIETSGFVGDIVGDDFLGGLVGNDMIYSQLTDCYACGTINATEGYVGGLVGRTMGSEFTRCYAACEITVQPEAQRIGVMAGYDSSGDYIDCLWDEQVNGILPGFGNTAASTVLINTTGETTAHMQTALTFQSQGWDFNTVWQMRCEGMNYPRLLGAPMLEGDFACPDGVGIEDVVMLSQCWLAAMDLVTELDDDGDRIVGLSEMARLGQYWLQTGCGSCGGIDVTGDGNVTEADLMDIGADWLREVDPECALCDINGDSDINLNDFSRLSQDWMAD